MTRPPVLLWELVRTAHLAERRLTRAIAEAGLTPAQFGVLSCLADGDELSQADLARVVLVRPQSMGRLVAAMIDAGLVVRDGPGGKGRRTGVAITSRGRAALDRARPLVAAASDPRALSLDDAAAAVVVDHLATLRRGLALEDQA